jgi:hypothetical protein
MNLEDGGSETCQSQKDTYVRDGKQLHSQKQQAKWQLAGGSGELLSLLTRRVSSVLQSTTWHGAP